MDTINDEDATDYDTLLTENHDAYKVKGRIIATKKSDSSLEANEVKFQVEATNNFDDVAFGNDPKQAAEDFPMKYSGTNAAELLFTYAEALVQKDSDENFVLLSITPYGANKTETLSASLYEKKSYKNNKISFYADANSSKSSDYKLSPSTAIKNDNGEVIGYDGAKIYVNGVLYEEFNDTISDSGVVTAAKIEKFIENNDSGTVTLIDKTDNGKTTTDGKIDYILVNYYEDAVVDSVSEGETYKIYFSKANTNIKTLKFDTTDKDKSATYKLDGQEIAYTDLQKGDVLSIAYDQTADFASSDFYDIIVSRNTVTGKVTGTDTDSNDETLYVINDTSYSSADSMYGTETIALTPGNDYVLYLNAFGKFVDYEEDTASKLIGVLYKVATTTADEKKVTLITSAGAKVSYEIKDGDKTKYDAWYNLCYESKTVTGEDGKEQTVTVRTPLKQRLVEYRVNSSGYITAVTAIADKDVKDATGDNAADYRTATTKLGSSIALSDSTIVLDLSSNDDPDDEITKVSSRTVADFNDGESYQVYATDKSTSDGTYRFVVVVKGGSTYNADTSIAIYDTHGSTYDAEQGATVDTLEVYMDGENTESEKGTRTIKLSSDLSVSSVGLKRGDVFVYDTDSDGYVNEVKKIFTALPVSNDNKAPKYGDFVNEIMNTTASPAKIGNKSYEKKLVWGDWAVMPNEWINPSNEKADEVEIVFGVITDKKNNNVMVSQITDVPNYTFDTNKYTDTSETTTKGVDKSKVADYTILNDANIYVYDFSESKDANRLYVGNASSLIKSPVPDSELLYDVEKDNEGNKIVYEVEDAENQKSKWKQGEKTDSFTLGRCVKSCVNSIKTDLLGENYGRNNFYQGGFST